MSQPRRKLAERSELLTLLSGLRVRSHTIGQQADEALREIRHAVEQFRELAGRKNERT